MLPRPFALLPLLLLAVLGGCRQTPTRIHIRDFQQPDAPRSLFQEFDQAWYELDDVGRLRLILRRHAPSHAIPTENITQCVLAETFWRPIPGTTYVESSMINARLTYLIRSGPTVRTYVGNGFVSFKENRKKNVLTGRIESATLKPTAQAATAPAPFGRATLDGTFRATRNPRRVAMYLTEINRTANELTPLSP